VVFAVFRHCHRCGTIFHLMLIGPLVFDKLFFPKLDPLLGTIGGVRHVSGSDLWAAAGGIVVRPLRRQDRSQIDSWMGTRL